MSAPDRAAFARGLRELADAIEADDRILLPPFGSLRFSVLGRTLAHDERDDQGLIADVTAMASALGNDVVESSHGTHLAAVGDFGAVEYIATACLKASIDDYNARSSYASNIQVAS